MVPRSFRLAAILAPIPQGPGRDVTGMARARRGHYTAILRQIRCLIIGNGRGTAALYNLTTIHTKLNIQTASKEWKRTSQ